MKHSIRKTIIVMGLAGAAGATIGATAELARNYIDNRVNGDGPMVATLRHAIGSMLHGACGGALSAALLVSDRW